VWRRHLTQAHSAVDLLKIESVMGAAVAASKGEKVMGQPQQDMSLVKLQSNLKLQVSREVTVRESDSLVDTHIQVNHGDTLIFQASGQIWAGVWFTGNNGPDGWTNVDNDPKFPLPGSHPYCLLGRLDNGPFFVGSTHRIDSAGDQGELFLEINDDVHGNGNGAFTCLVQQYR
jgi:hypothetical protein